MKDEINQEAEQNHKINMIVHNAAKMAHQINKAYCIAHGDNSQQDWEQAPDWQRESAVNGVIFHLNNPDATPADSHVNWLKEKADAGWKYGEEKDVEKKLHPCMVPFDKLPLEQQIKDHLFHASVHNVFGMLGLIRKPIDAQGQPIGGGNGQGVQ